MRLLSHRVMFCYVNLDTSLLNQTELTVVQSSWWL